MARTYKRDNAGKFSSGGSSGGGKKKGKKKKALAKRDSNTNGNSNLQNSGGRGKGQKALQTPKTGKNKRLRTVKKASGPKKGKAARGFFKKGKR